METIQNVINVIDYKNLMLWSAISCLLFRNFILSTRMGRVKDYAQITHWLYNIRFDLIKEKKVDDLRDDKKERDVLRRKLYEKYPYREIYDINKMVDDFYGNKSFFWNKKEH